MHGWRVVCVYTYVRACVLLLFLFLYLHVICFCCVCVFLFLVFFLFVFVCSCVYLCVRLCARAHVCVCAVFARVFVWFLCSHVIVCVLSVHQFVASFMWVIDVDIVLPMCILQLYLFGPFCFPDSRICDVFYDIFWRLFGVLCPWSLVMHILNETGL